MQKINFTKMHGLGNDFIIIDRRHDKIDITTDLINRLSDRKSGAGCDQLITIELNNTNFNFFTTENTAGANCIDCNNQAPPPPPPPPPPAPTCFQVAVYKSAISAIDLCSQTQQRTVNLNASTLGAASQVFLDTDCTNLVTLPQWFSETTSGNYWYWNGSSFAGPYTQNCP